MAILRCTSTCGVGNNEKKFYVSTKFYNNDGKCIWVILDRWEYMYTCEKCQNFKYPNFTSLLDEKTKQFITMNKKKYYLLS